MKHVAAPFATRCRRAPPSRQSICRAGDFAAIRRERAPPHWGRKFLGRKGGRAAPRRRICYRRTRAGAFDRTRAKLICKAGAAACAMVQCVCRMRGRGGAELILRAGRWCLHLVYSAEIVRGLQAGFRLEAGKRSAHSKLVSQIGVIDRSNDKLDIRESVGSSRRPGAGARWREHQFLKRKPILWNHSLIHVSKARDIFACI